MRSSYGSAGRHSTFLGVILLAAALAGSCGGDDPEEQAPITSSDDTLAGAIGNMEALDSFRAILLSDRPEEEFQTTVDAEAAGNFQTTIHLAAKTSEGRDLDVTFLAHDDHLYYQCSPKDECDGWVRSTPTIPIPTLLQSLLLDLETFPLWALKMADGLEFVDDDEIGLHFRGTVNSTLALREHQREAFRREGITDFGNDSSTALHCTGSAGLGETPTSTCIEVVSTPSGPVSFDEVFAESLEGADINALPLSTIEAWINRDDHLITRILMTTPEEDVNVGDFSGTLGGYTLDTRYSGFNEVSLKPPDEFTIQEPFETPYE